MSGEEKATNETASTQKPAPKGRDAIVDALLRLAARRDFGEITISDIAREAGIGLADFRDLFPSKGAILGAFSRRIDREVLTGASGDLDTHPARDRLRAVLTRRLEALEPYRDAIFAISSWASGEPLSAAAFNREMVNSMRFMLEAADIDSEGAVGTLKLQGLALAWKRVIDAWRKDRPGENFHALAALDDALDNGEKIVDRVEDFARTTEPLRRLANRLFEGFTKGRTGRSRHEVHDFDEEHPHAGT
jgi:AcrR family transcriptional regulator